MERKEIDAKYKWDLSVIYADDNAFNLDYMECEKDLKDYSRFASSMSDSAEGLLDALNEYARIDATLERLWLYASLSFSVDSSDSKNQVMYGRMRNLAVMAGSATWFVTPKILKIGKATLTKWFNECPSLESYRRMIEKTLRMKEHTLSDDCEQLLSKVEDCTGGCDATREIFASSDLRFGKIRGEDGKLVELADTNYVSFLLSGDRRVRKDAFRTLYKTYDSFKNTFATLYNGHVKECVTMAKVRNYKNSITASTFRDEVTPVIYNNLIKSVHTGMSTIHDYYEMKREVLGLDKLHLYDVYAPLVGELKRSYTYEEAVEEVLKSVKIFGDEYYNTLKAGLTERGWVDVYPSRGKRGGAFSSGCPGCEPYILLNFNGNLDDVSTLAHEAGHSMHTYFSTKYNEPHNSGYTIFVAEVASTVNELLMAHRLIKESKSDEEKMYILNQLMETYKGTLYRQTMFAEFERNMHALVEDGQPLTAELISDKYRKLVRRYFGKAVSCDKQIALEWCRIPHFYSAFYVYKYATCISAASAIVKRIETEGEEYVSKYIDFLKCGGSKSPLDSLLVAGIDMTRPEVVLDAIDDFASCISQFRELYNKTKK